MILKKKILKIIIFMRHTQELFNKYAKLYIFYPWNVIL